MVLKYSALITSVFVLLWLTFTAALNAQGPIDSTFTFQGRLIKNSVYITDTCDFQFNLFDDPSGGTFVAGPVSKTGVSVVEGYFTADLDFGSVFTGDKRYLQVTVQCSADGGPTDLNGRMELTGAPYALYAQNAANAGSTDWTDITGIPSPDFADNIDNTGALSNYSCINGQILVTDTVVTNRWGCGNDAGSSTAPPLDHGITLITTSLADDDHPQYFLVNGSRAMGNNLNMGSNRITNVGAGINSTDAVNRTQAIERADAGGGDLGSIYNTPSVTGIRGRSVAATTPISGYGLVSDGTVWQIGLVGPSGPAGGDFVGSNFPDPQIAPDVVDSTKIADNAVGSLEIAANAVDSSKIVDDAVGSSEIIADGVNTSEIAPNAVRMSELNVPMGFGSRTGFDLADGANYMGFTPAFTPDVNGTCMVVASASFRSPGSSAAGTRLRAAMQTNNDSSTNSANFEQQSDFGNSNLIQSATVNVAWNVTANVPTRFGCYIYVFDSNAHDDEVADCRVSYVCE